MGVTVGKALIEVSDYTFSYERKPALRDISLTITAGERLSVIGPNGAGKTTLLKCMARILTGGKGSIRINGRQIGDYNQKDLAKFMSYVPQAQGCLVPFTVREFILMGRYPHLSPFSTISKQDIEAVSEAIVLTGTEDYAERSLCTLSGGECQKVFIAAALAQGAKILLLDEPTTFLDPRHQDDISRTLMRINRESGVTLVWVTHDINSAVLYSDRILALKDGAAAFCGPPEGLMNNETLERIYEKSFLFVRHPQTGQPVVVQSREET